jgi:cyanate lyase
MTKKEAAAQVREAKARLGLTWAQLAAAVPTDPTTYRFYEVLQVYGTTIKELIHEEFGDAINGKFLPYQW